MQKLIFILGSLVLLISCKNSKNTPNVSNIKVDASIVRFDEDFFAPTQNLTEHLSDLQKKYGKIFDYYLSKTGISDGISVGRKPEVVVADFLKVHTPLYDSSQLQFKNLEWLQKDLTKGFQFYKYYFPNYKVPKIYAIVDGFYAENPQSYYGVEYGIDTLLISLQMFLGKNFSGYDPDVYFDYLRVRFTKNYIVKNTFTTIINQQFTPISQDAPMIEQFIDAGKRVYLLDKLLPNTPDEIKLGFTKKQLSDSYTNEKNIWSYFVNEDLLFNNEVSITKEYIGENPFTKGLGTESPGNIGAFVGWQIIKKYVEKNKNLTPEQLTKADPKIIYNEAKYKP